MSMEENGERRVAQGTSGFPGADCGDCFLSELLNAK